MTTLLILLALLWPAFWLLRVLLVTKIIVGLEFRHARVKTHAPGEVPPFITEASQPWARQLQVLEFRALGGWRIGSFAEPALDEEAAVFVHATQPVLAVVRLREESGLDGECWLSLRSTLPDGREIVTSSHASETILPGCVDVLVEVLPTTLASELLQRHHARVTEAGVAPWEFRDLASAAHREKQVRDACVNDAVATGLLSPRTGGGFSFRLKPAFQQALTAIKIGMKNKKLLKAAGGRMPNTKPLSPENLLSFDLYHYRQMVGLTSGRLSLRAKAIISSVSFVIFAAVLAWQYSLVVATTLVIALVIHEGGHLLGMRLFGFRDTQLLFIPFFGGAAVGLDDKVLKPWQHIVIVLLGPLPGIFIALGLFVYIGGGNAPAWVTQVALTTFILNAFNLLPIMPLDGGQIVDYAVASRFPRARVLFLGLSAGGMALIGLAGGGARLLLYLGIATLLRLPVEWRSAGIRRAMREEFPQGGEEEPIVRRLLEHVREPEWAKVSSSQRLQLVRGLQLALRMPPAGIGTLVFALITFTSPLWLGAPLAFWSVIRSGEAKVRHAVARAEEAGVRPLRPPAPPAGLAPEDNAAIDVAKAEKIIGASRHFLAEETGDEKEDAPADADTDVVALLRAAAHKKVFAPEPRAKAAGKNALLNSYSRTAALHHLRQAAQERVRYQEPLEAIAIDLDALRLLRLMQQSPGALDWPSYHVLAGSCWLGIEEALSSGVAPSPELVGQLRDLSAEQPVIDFAATAIPASLLAQGSNKALEESGEEGDETGWLVTLMRLNPYWTKVQVQTIDQAVVAQEQLRQIKQGKWPAPTKVEIKEDSEALSAAFVEQPVAQLADLLAIQRQLRTALRITELRQRGSKDIKLDSLGTDPTDLNHPFTGEKMRLTRRGALDVLAFNSSFQEAWREDERSEETDLHWRVPVELR